MTKTFILRLGKVLLLYDKQPLTSNSLNMKKLYILLLTFLVIVASLITCSDHEAISLVKQQFSMSDIYLTVSLNTSGKSKPTSITSAEQSLVNRCILEIYQGDILCNRLFSEIKEEQANFKLNIPNLREYDFIFWADYVEDSNSDGSIDDMEIRSDLYYNTQEGLKNIDIDIERYPYDGNNVYRDAYFGSSSTFVSDHCDMIMVLNRPFAQLNIITNLSGSDEEQCPNSIKIDFLTHLPTRINALTGETSQEQHIKWYGKRPIIDLDNSHKDESRVLLSSDYLFCNSSKEISLSISIFNKSGSIIELDSLNSFENIPLEKNCFTNINYRLHDIGNDYSVDILPIYDINTPTGIEYFTFKNFPLDYSSIKSGTWVIADNPRSDADFIKIRNALKELAKVSTIRLQFPDVEIIPEYIFSDIDNLVAVVATNVHTVGISAFSGCAKLEHIHLPEVKILKASAFKNCKSLKEIDLPSATRIDSYAFKNIATESIYMPKLSFIGANAFEKCTELRHIELPLLNHIEKNAFKDCANLVTAIISTQSESVGHISPLIFSGSCQTKKIHLTTSRHNTTNVIDDITWIIPSATNKIQIGPFQFITIVI